ncbi:MAG: hypothetical protein AB7J13_15295, partial [Pyrinomonadaceae bacterium]
MLQKLLPLMGLIAVTALPVFSQNNSPKPSGPNTTTRLSSLEADLARYLEMDDDDGKTAPGRPRIVPVKSSAVRSVVVVNTAALSRTAFDLVNKKRADLGLSSLT